MSGRALVDYGRLLDVLSVEAELLIDAARSGSEDLAIPSCPGLTLGKTVRHLGSVYRAVLTWLRTGERPTEWARQPAVEESAAEFMLGGLRPLADELAAQPADSIAATWWPEDQTYGFWRRRMAHETTVHRVDVQDAVGIEVTAVDAEIALDGVDEVLTLWFGRRLEMLGLSGNREASVAVRSGGREWLARASRDGTSAHLMAPGVLPAANASVSAEPMPMYLWLWGRRPTRTVEIDGDDDSVAQLWALLRLATR